MSHSVPDKPELDGATPERAARLGEVAPPLVVPTPTAPIVQVRSAHTYRQDVLLRARREEGEEASIWWPISAFLVTSALVVVLLGWVPGGA